MGKDSSEEAAAAARRRLELLSRELAQAGLSPARPDPLPVVDLTPALVPEPGRHARARRATAGERATDWVQERVPATLQGRVTLKPAHVAVLAVLVGVALVVTAFVVLRSQPEAGLVPPPRPARALVSTAPSAVASPGSAPDAPTGGRVVVDVAGKVRRPGVATLPAGSRVIDAIRRAGGPRKGVSLTSINLARLLVDGEQILVGTPAATGVAPSAASAPGAASPDALVDLNTATQEQLESLPGVGPVTAEKILAWRDEHGSFTSVDDLLEVDGIGEKTLAELAPHLTL